MHVVGERGTIDVDVFRQALTHYDDRSGVTKLVGWGDDLNGLMVGGFADAILAGRLVPVLGTGVTLNGGADAHLPAREQLAAYLARTFDAPSRARGRPIRRPCWRRRSANRRQALRVLVATTAATVAAATGFDLRVRPGAAETPRPTDVELRVLREAVYPEMEEGFPEYVAAHRQ